LIEPPAAPGLAASGAASDAGSTGAALAPAKPHDVADLALAGAGQARIEWADALMPVLAQVRARFARERPLEGVCVAACLHVTAETANLVRTLMAGGAEVSLCASNPLSTQDETAAALVESYGAEVFAVRGEDAETYYGHIDAVCDRRPQITMDDGADVVSVIHGRRADLVEGIVGGTEETTTGVIRLRALQKEGRLAFPVVAVNEASTKHLMDNRYGTGQSTLDGIVRATGVLLAGSRVVVFGYGWCGRGVALRAKGAGAHVIVCEVDPLRALEAVMDGYEVMPGVEAAARGDVLVTVTGGRDAIGAEHFAAMRDGAIVANAGHFDVEISKADLEAATESSREVRPSVREHRTHDGRRIHLLAQGRVVNLAAADGHPAAVMDISFANQALCVEYLVRHGERLEDRVYGVPEAIDAEIARLKLEALGVAIDSLSELQRAYLRSWRQGT
jgi:adenosylhomocysteinase